MNFRLLLVLSTICLLACTLALGYLLLEGKVDEWSDVPKPVAIADQPRRPDSSGDKNKVVNGIHLVSGLIAAPGYDLVRTNCTICHSAKLVTQNRATREGWAQMIDWMQETQGLWDLGKNEPKILDYLAANYAPEEVGRRSSLDVEAIEWYVLELDK